MKRQVELLTEFKSYHRIVVVASTHNFLVTSKMKDYIDNIFLPCQVYKYTEK